MNLNDSGGSVVPILLPQAGNSMEEGTILKWVVQVGDRVRAGDTLFELETDKATIEVEAEAEGRIARIVVGEGQTAPVKTPVAFLAESDEAVDAYLASSVVQPPQPALDHPSTSPAVPVALPEFSRASDRPKASPAARKAAQALGVDLGLVRTGSGPSGRILVEDVERAASSVSSSVGDKRVPLPKMRRAIAANLQHSKQTVPHFYTKVTVDAGPMLATLAEAKQRYACGVNDLIVAAVARVVQETTEFRSRIEGSELVVSPAANIGLAVALDDSLVVPVLTRAEKLSLSETASRCRSLIQGAQEGRLDGVGEGVFTISNLGMHGVEEFSAIINPPESAILAVGAIRESVIVRGGAMRAGKVMTLVLSADHRVVDGVVAAKFVARLKALLEAPAEIEGLL